MGFPACNLREEGAGAAAAELFGTARGLTGPAPDVDIFLDAAGDPDLLKLFQEMGKIGSRMVVVTVLAGLPPLGRRFSLPRCLEMLPSRFRNLSELFQML